MKPNLAVVVFAAVVTSAAVLAHHGGRTDRYGAWALQRRLADIPLDSVLAACRCALADVVDLVAINRFVTEVARGAVPALSNTARAVKARRALAIDAAPVAFNTVTALAGAPIAYVVRFLAISRHIARIAGRTIVTEIVWPAVEGIRLAAPVTDARLAHAGRGTDISVANRGKNSVAVIGVYARITRDAALAKPATRAQQPRLALFVTDTVPTRVRRLVGQTQVIDTFEPVTATPLTVLAEPFWDPHAGTVEAVLLPRADLQLLPALGLCIVDIHHAMDAP